MRLTWRQVRRWRIRRQLLLSPAPDAVEVARTLGGIHAQVTSCSALIAGIRCAGPPDLARGLVRTWAARGTLPDPAKRMIRAADDAVTAVEVDGEAGYVVRAEDVDELAATPDGGSDPADAPLLLPAFDPWVLSPISHRTRAVPDGRMGEVSRTAGWISPVLVIDGVVAGVWEHTGPAVTIRPFDPLPARTRTAVEQAAARYGPLLDADTVAVTWA